MYEIGFLKLYKYICSKLFKHKGKTGKELEKEMLDEIDHDTENLDPDNPEIPEEPSIENMDDPIDVIDIEPEIDPDPDIDPEIDPPIKQPDLLPVTPRIYDIYQDLINKVKKEEITKYNKK